MDAADVRLAKIEEYVGELSALSGGASGSGDILRRLDAIERHLGLKSGNLPQRLTKPGIH